MRAAAGEIAVTGPRRFLLALYEWCDGSRSIEDIERLATAKWGPSRFGAFLRQMLASGVLIDAAGSLANAYDAAQLPSRLGRAAAQETWEAARLRAHAARLSATVLRTATRLPAARSRTLATLIDARRSAPAFGGRPIAARALAALLDAFYGIAAGGDAPLVSLRRRSVPSAGGFKLLRVLLVLILPVGRFRAGIYDVVHLMPGQVELSQVAEGSTDWCRALVDAPGWLEATGFLVVAADTSVAALKYCGRSLPFALIEAGAVLQNGGLAAAELELGYRLIGGYYADRVASLCRLGGERVLGCAGFGSLPEAQAVRDRQKRKRLRFHWADNDTGSRLHVAAAEVESAETSSIGWGRAADPLAACAIAMSEAVERYSYSRLGKCVAAKAGELEGAVDPRSLVLYAPDQYLRPEMRVSPFDGDRDYLWVAARRWQSKRPAWVPAECAYAAAALPPLFADRALARTTSSGCATDARLEIARERAAFEVIERDALARHWLAQNAGAGISASSCPAAIAARISGLAERGCDVSIAALEGDCGPVVLVTIVSETRGFGAMGTACGIDLEASLDRAFTEAEIVASVRLRQNRLPRIAAQEVRKPMDHSDLYAQRRHYRRIHVLTQGGRREDFAALAERWPSTLKQRLREPARLLWIDLTADDAPLGPGGVELRTVRALIPGCISIGFGRDAIPRGSVGAVSAAARFPHPLA